MTHTPLAPMAIVALMLVLAAEGCSCGEPQSDHDRYCAQISELQCDHEISCGRTSAAHREQCIAMRGRELCGDWPRRVDRGFARFDAAGGGRCVEELRARMGQCALSSIYPGVQLGQVMSGGQTWPRPTCGDRLPEPAAKVASACDNLYSPASQTGEGCFDVTDCAREEDGCTGVRCEGTCQPAGGLGQPCGREGCDPGLYCDPETWSCRPVAPLGGDCSATMGVCEWKVATCDGATQTCVSLPKAGEACAGDACAPGHYCEQGTCVAYLLLDEPCSQHRTCTPGLFCRDGVCKARGNEGESCSYYSECRDDLRCVQGVCIARLGEGEWCRGIAPRYASNQSYFDCIQCGTALGCDGVLGTCSAPRAAQPGEPCTGSTIVCTEDHVCRGAWSNPDGGAPTLGTCGPRQLAASCLVNTDCPEHSICQGAVDGGTGVCTEARTGGPCLEHGHCRPEDFCDVQVCRPRLLEGEVCDPLQWLRPCAAPLACARRSGAEPICYRQRAAGESCDPKVLDACMFPLGCVGGRCEEVGRVGQPCLANGRCFEGGCTGAGPTAVGTCELEAADGDACQTHADCASRSCKDGRCEAACR